METPVSQISGINITTCFHSGSALNTTPMVPGICQAGVVSTFTWVCSESSESLPPVWQILKYEFQLNMCV